MISSATIGRGANIDNGRNVEGAMRVHLILALGVARAIALPVALAITFALPLALAVSARADEPKVAVFDFEFVDTSLEGAEKGPRADEQARLAALGKELRHRLAQSGRFDVVDITPIEAAARASNLRAC